MFEFLIFALVTGITPGPNNSMLMVSGIRFGVAKSIPHFLGVCFGFSFLFFSGGFILNYVPPVLYRYIRYIGYGVIFYIAFRIATAPIKETKTRRDKPLTFIQACLFQWVNPKGVVMAVSGLTAYGISNVTGALIYFVVLPFICGVWLLAGNWLQSWLLNHPRAGRAVYLLLALSMVGSLLLA